MGGHLLEGIRLFYEDVSAAVHVSGELSECFGVSVRQWCVVLP